MICDSILKMAEKILVPFRLPSDDGRVFKEECIFCFQSPEHDGGVLISLRSHYGYCPEHVKYEALENTGFLHYGRIRRRTKKASEPENKITKLAIGVEGGLQETQYEFEEKYDLMIFPGPNTYQLTDPRLDEKLRSCCDALIACESATRREELEALAGTWDGSFVVETKHTDLPQLTPAPKISPQGWRCQAEGCDKMDNLWLNLTDGKIFCGRRYHDGTGGNNHAVEHFRTIGYPLAVKLGTITAHQADVFSYDEDEMVLDPKLDEHLAHFGINRKLMEKTDKTMLELELDLNQKFEFLRIQESGKNLEPVYGPGFTGLINLGSSCYMNSVIQTLSLIPEIKERYGTDSAEHIFQEFMLAAKEPFPNPSDNVPLQFAKMFNGILSGKFSKAPQKKVEENVVIPDASVKPLSFRTLVGKGHPEFATGRQQDVEEYTRWLFEKFEQQKGIGAEHIVDAFRFEVIERIFCEATNRATSHRRPDVILSLPIPMDKAINMAEVREFEERSKADKAAGKIATEVVLPKVPLRDCLEAFAVASKIDGARSPFDERLMSRLTKTQRLSTFPDYLLIQLKRFTWNDDWTPKKLEVEIELNEELSIENLAVPPDQRNELANTEAPATANNPDFTPEELAGLPQLIDAGFSMNACRKALRQSGGQIDGAFEWLLTHSGDPDFDEPLAAVNQLQTNENDPLTNEITGMGFTRDQARKALRLSNRNVEQAIAWLLDNPGDPGESADAAGGSNQAGVKKYRNGSGKYRLIGFISHMGSSAHSGHYVCHLLKNVEGMGKRWVIYNDEKVALSEDPPKGFGYLYLYERAN